MFWCKNAVDELLWNKSEGDNKNLAIWQSMASGFLAACPGMVLTNPFDIVKTRLMAQEKAGGQPKYRGLFGTMFTIAREEGFLRLYNGLLPRILRVPPGMVSFLLPCVMYPFHLGGKHPYSLGRNSTVSHIQPQAITWGVTDQVVQMYEKS